jgi:hypothetical protein
MRFWKRESILVEPWRASTKLIELETAKEILSEVFHARPSDVEEKIQRRLEEKNSSTECEDVLWPSAFCLVD